jgi:hypothetical protein
MTAMALASTDLMVPSSYGEPSDSSTSTPVDLPRRAASLHRAANGLKSDARPSTTFAITIQRSLEDQMSTRSKHGWSALHPRALERPASERTDKRVGDRGALIDGLSGDWSDMDPRRIDVGPRNGRSGCDW